MVNDTHNLRDWCNYERTYAKKKTYPDYRSSALSQVEGWIWDAREANWNDKFELLRQYGKEFGHVKLKQSETYRGEKLGQWLSIQRLRPDQRNAKRTALLERLGVEWPEGQST